MPKKKKKWPWIILSTLTTLLLIICLLITGVANYFGRSINMFLNVRSDKVVSPNTSEDTNYFPAEYDSIEEMSLSDQEICERVEAEGAVLLKNNGILPLAGGSTVSTFSHSSVDPVYGGTGSGDVAVTDSTPTLLSSLTEAGLKVNKTLWDFYLTGNGSGENYTRVIGQMSGFSAGQTNYSLNEVPWSVIEAENGLLATFDGTTAVVTISRIGGEGMDLPNGKTTTSTFYSTRTGELENASGDYLALGDDEIELLKQLKNLKDTGAIDGIVVLINSSHAIQADFLEDPAYDIDAALWIGSVGERGLLAVGDILAGNVNPSGHLADTYVYDNFSAPSAMNCGTISWTNYEDYDDLALQSEIYYTLYQEGIYVGYLYYETRYEDYVMGTGNAGDYVYNKTVAYPFGFGLSYTDFTYNNLVVTESTDSYTLSVDVKNNGSIAGKDVVEVYLQSPYTDYDKQYGIEKAAARLCGYTKTALLAPGETQNVVVEIDKTELASYDANGAQTYILDAGDYYFGIGNGSHNAINNILAAKGYTPENTDGRMDATGDASLVHHIIVNELDTETYSVSSHTGVEITNQFENSDLNKFDNGSQPITYVTRNDWTGTLPTAQVKLELSDAFVALMHAYDEFEEDPNAVMPTFGEDNGLTLAMLIGKDYDDPMWDKLLNQMSKDEMITLLTNCMHTTPAISSIAKPQTLDENGPAGLNQTYFGGEVNSTAYPSAVVLASTFNQELIEEVGTHIGENGFHCDISGLYGPAANIHRTPHAGRNFEYYSEDAVLSSETCTAFVKGVQSKGMTTYVKHFALCDSESRRYGNAILSNEQAIREIYLKAFENAIAIDEGNSHAIMTSHTRVGATWCGQDQNLLGNVVRGEWGFDGFIITDMDAGLLVSEGKGDTLFMHAPNSIISGTDAYITMFPYYRSGQLNEVKDSPTVMQAVRESSHRMLYTLVNSAAMNGISTEDRVEIVLTGWQKALIGIDIVFLVLTVLCFKKLFKTIKYNKALKEQK